MHSQLLDKSKVRLYLDLAKDEGVRPWIEEDVSKIRHFPARIRSGDPDIDALSMKEADVWSSAQKWLAQRRPTLKRIICDQWGYCARRSSYGDDHEKLVADVAAQIRGAVGVQLADLVATILFKESLFSLCECGDTKGLMRQAIAAYERGVFNSSTASQFAHIAELDPDCHRAHYYQGSILLKQHRYNEALPFHLKAFRLCPSDGVYLNDLAYIYATEDMDLEAAEGYAAMALKMFSDDPVNRPACSDTLGWVLTRRRRFADALPYLLEAVDVVRRGVDAFGGETLQEVLYHLAATYVGLGDSTGVAAAVAEIRKIGRDSYWARLVETW